MSKRLGIIGGGQLALYLCQAARGLGLTVAILEESADATALTSADRSFVGPLDDASALKQLLAVCDVVTFDKEAIPDAALEYLQQAQAGGQIAVHPGVEILMLLKDKGLQKAWLQEKGLPTLPFYTLSGRASCPATLQNLFDGALVQKSRCGGYDGRGVQILETFESAEQLWDVPSIVEPYLADCREISVITARGVSGDIETYPPVSMAFDAQINAVSIVSMPAAISEELAEAATALAEKVVTLLDGVGVFAIEMFITPEEELLINEISPRVHNSGHLTLDACNVSQFEQHVRAVTGMPLLQVKAEPAAAMVNILYTEALQESCPPMPVINRSADPTTSVYWYGKAPGTAGRKMGHINAVAASDSSAVALASSAMAQLYSGAGGYAA